MCAHRHHLILSRRALGQRRRRRWLWVQAYNMGSESDARGDGYMNAYAKVLRQCPWMPVVGK